MSCSGSGFRHRWQPWAARHGPKVEPYGEPIIQQRTNGTRLKQEVHSTERRAQPVSAAVASGICHGLRVFRRVGDVTASAIFSIRSRRVKSVFFRLRELSSRARSLSSLAIFALMGLMIPRAWSPSLEWEREIKDYRRSSSRPMRQMGTGTGAGAGMRIPGA